MEIEAVSLIIGSIQEDRSLKIVAVDRLRLSTAVETRVGLLLAWPMRDIVHDVPQGPRGDSEARMGRRPPATGHPRALLAIPEPGECS
jgi:hypothetical protein